VRKEGQEPPKPHRHKKSSCLILFFWPDFLDSHNFGFTYSPPLSQEVDFPCWKITNKVITGNVGSMDPGPGRGLRASPSPG